ncbi:MAG: aminotransferase class V-fold PLP-dependent enzyme [Actinobacteria bacterium]|nr:aminotransferase class V-fold PLP-dependent enzyme [Actinomycetota bacterium]
MPATDVPSPLPEPAPTPPLGYLDAVGGQPLLPRALRAQRAALDQAWSDPARLHHAGRRAGMVLDAARASIATALGVRPVDVYFTSSGPTAIRIAVDGLLRARAGASAGAVVGAVESLAVLEPVHALADEVMVIPVDGVGRVDLDAFAEALARPAALACLQAANAEVGTRQPLARVARLARDHDVPLLVHAIQVIGRDPVPEDWDVLAASARDWGGPSGVGVLAVRPSVRWRPDQSPDRGWVGGFPDIAAAAAAATALEYLTPVAAAESARLFGLVDLIRRQLPTLASGIGVVGDPVDRLPHIVTFTCEGVVGEVLVGELDRRGVSVASGSACTADARMASHVLPAMGPASDASVRVSLPLGCSAATVDLLLREFPSAVAAARAGLEP